MLNIHGRGKKNNDITPSSLRPAQLMPALGQFMPPHCCPSVCLLVLWRCTQSGMSRELSVTLWLLHSVNDRVNYQAIFWQAHLHFPRSLFYERSEGPLERKGSRRRGGQRRYSSQLIHSLQHRRHRTGFVCPKSGIICSERDRGWREPRWDQVQTGWGWRRVHYSHLPGWLISRGEFRVLILRDEWWPRVERRPVYEATSHPFFKALETRNYAQTWQRMRLHLCHVMIRWAQK